MQGAANYLESTSVVATGRAVEIQKDPSQGSIQAWGGTCGLGHNQAEDRKALVPCLIGKGSQRGHRSLVGVADSLVLGWNILQLPSLRHF